MATRDELYAKFGITAEAAQLFETELGTLLLAVSAIEHGWDTTPDPPGAQKALDQIEGHTPGRLLGVLKGKVVFDENLAERFTLALKARNRLNHGFYERHNFKIQTAKAATSWLPIWKNFTRNFFRFGKSRLV